MSGPKEKQAMTKSAFIEEVHAGYIKKREIFPNLDHPNTN